jgi:hypothetical protein
LIFFLKQNCPSVLLSVLNFDTALIFISLLLLDLG